MVSLCRRMICPTELQVAHLPAHLPRVEEVIPVPANERHCATCGGAKCALGHDVTELLDLRAEAGEKKKRTGGCAAIR